MKIGIVTTMNALPWAGSEELWWGAAQELLSAGHDIHVYYPAVRGWAAQLTALREAGARIHPFGWKSPILTALAGLVGKRISRTPVVPPLPQSNAWRSMDLVLVSQGGCVDGQPWLDLLARRGIPYVVLCQANMECVWPDDQTAARLRHYFGNARSALFVSAENERLFRVQTGYEVQNTVVVWNPLQPSTPKEPIPWPANESTWRMAAVGRIEPFAKGQDLLIEVLGRADWRARDLKLTIFGRGPWEMTARRLVEQRNLQNISFGGFATPAEIWEGHHILALPSRHEGMSLAMLEAMWLGRPILSTAVAGAMSEVQEGSNGFLSRAASVDSWAEAMENAWTQRQEWRAMGLSAAQSIRARMPANPKVALAELLVSCA
jgi:glycosyltransferase involved in cell wall biosynthesis